MDAAEKVLKFDIQDELLACLPDMHAFARFLVKDYERADDLVQEATVRVLAAANQFQPGTNFKAWVFTILRNLYYNELQKSKRFVDFCSEPLPSELSEMIDRFRRRRQDAEIGPDTVVPLPPPARQGS